MLRDTCLHDLVSARLGPRVVVVFLRYEVGVELQRPVTADVHFSSPRQQGLGAQQAAFYQASAKPLKGLFALVGPIKQNE